MAGARRVPPGRRDGLDGPGDACQNPKSARSFGGMATLRNAHFDLSTDGALRLVKLVRSEEPFHSVREMITVLDEIFHTVSDLDGSTYGLFIDNRKGPARNDPSFQNAFRSFRLRLDERFARVGVVLASDESVKQLEQAGPSPNVRAYTDERAALRWATEGIE